MIIIAVIFNFLNFFLKYVLHTEKKSEHFCNFDLHFNTKIISVFH